MAIKGNFSRFQRHIDRVDKLGQPGALKSLTDNLAEEACDLVLEGFATETDPYGKKWAPKVFGDGRSVLIGKTGNLKRSWGRRNAIKRSDGRGFRIAPSVVYAVYHQKGTGIYGPRKQPIVPTKGKFLAFTAEGYVTKKAYLGAKSAWAASITSSTNIKDAKASFRRNVSGLNSSKIFVRSVKGCKPRMMVPKEGDLPKAWNDAFVETCDVWFNKNFDQ